MITHVERSKSPNWSAIVVSATETIVLSRKLRNNPMKTAVSNSMSRRPSICNGGGDPFSELGGGCIFFVGVVVASSSTIGSQFLSIASFVECAVVSFQNSICKVTISSILKLYQRSSRKSFRMGLAFANEQFRPTYVHTGVTYMFVNLDWLDTLQFD